MLRSAVESDGRLRPAVAVLGGGVTHAHAHTCFSEEPCFTLDVPCAASLHTLCIGIWRRSVKINAATPRTMPQRETDFAGGGG